MSNTEAVDGMLSREVKYRYGLRGVDWSGVFLRLITQVNSEAEPRKPLSSSSNSCRVGM